MHILIHPISRKYLRFIYDHQVFQFTALPFGMSLSPWVFTKLMNVIATHLRLRAVSLFPYLDDWLIRDLIRNRLTRTSNLRKLRTVLFINEWILSYFCVILSGDCVYSCSLLRRFAEICVFTNKFPYIRRNVFVAVYKRTEQSPHSERSTS